MRQSSRRHVPGRMGLVGAVGSIVMAAALSGCPGTLDPALLTGEGGSAGGSSGGGTTGAGGASPCTGAMAGDALVTSNCAVSGCHTTADAPISGGGLDLTINATIGSRLVGVVSPGDSTADSVCGGSTYLKAMSNPATGLLIDKIKGTQTCGLGMPYPGGSAFLLPSAKQTCIEQWAEGLIVAAP
jgi:hypothetical protein